MRFKRQHKLECGFQQIDLVPFINVAFLILLFFALVSSLTFESGINVKLPKALTSDVVKEGNVIIAITSENVIYLNGRITTIKELMQSLKSVPQNSPVLIKADRRASVGRIVDVWNLGRSLGIEQINIATNQSH